jgi:hypothetical protein
MVFTHAKYYNDKIWQNKKGGTYSAYFEEDKFIAAFWWKKLKERITW